MVKRLVFFIELFGQEDKKFGGRDNENENENEKEEEGKHREKGRNREKEDGRGDNGDDGNDQTVDNVSPETLQAVRILVETSASLLLSVLATPAGARAAFAEPDVVQKLQNIALKAVSLALDPSPPTTEHESYPGRVLKLVLAGMWSLLEAAPREEYPRSSSSSASMLSRYAKLLHENRFVDRLCDAASNPRLSPSLRIQCAELRSCILFCTRQIVKQGTRRKKADVEAETSEFTRTCDLLSALLDDDRAVMLAYAAMAVAREAHRPRTREMLTERGTIARLKHILRASTCRRLDTFVLHALLNLSAGSREQNIMGERQLLTTLLGRVSSGGGRGATEETIRSGPPLLNIDFAHFDLYRKDVCGGGPMAGLEGTMSRPTSKLSQNTTGANCTLWIDQVSHRFFSNVLSEHPPHRGDQAAIFASRILSNLSKHPENRTLLYKIELERATQNAKHLATAPTPKACLRFKGNAIDADGNPLRSRPKDKATANIRDRFDQWLTESVGREKGDSGSGYKGGGETRAAAMSEQPQSEVFARPTSMVPQRPLGARRNVTPSDNSSSSRAVGRQLQQPLSSMWKSRQGVTIPRPEAPLRRAGLNTPQIVAVMNGDHNRLGRTRFDMKAHRMIAVGPATRTLRALPAMTNVSRSHPRSRRWRPHVSKIDVTVEEMEGGCNTSTNDSAISTRNGRGLSAEDEILLEQERQRVALPGLAGLQASREEPVARVTTNNNNNIFGGGDNGAQKSSRNATAVIELVPKSPRHTFTFHPATVNRVLVCCFEISIYGFGADTFDDFASRAFCEAMRLRLGVHENLHIGCHLCSTAVGSVQHSPFRVRLHVSIEAAENGHDVAGDLCKAIDTFRDADYSNGQRARGGARKQKNQAPDSEQGTQKKQSAGSSLKNTSPLSSPKSPPSSSNKKTGKHRKGVDGGDDAYEDTPRSEEHFCVIFRRKLQLLHEEAREAAKRHRLRPPRHHEGSHHHHHHHHHHEDGDTAPAFNPDDYEEYENKHRTLQQAAAHRYQKRHLPERIEIISMTTAHRAFEDSAIFGAVSPNQDVSLGKWAHVKGSQVSKGLFPKFQGPNGEEFFLYSKRRMHDLPCAHAGPLAPLGDTLSMEQAVHVLSEIIEKERAPVPRTEHEEEKTQADAGLSHTGAYGDQPSVVPPDPPAHNLTVPVRDDDALWGVLPMEDERMTLVVALAHEKKMAISQHDVRDGDDVMI